LIRESTIGRFAKKLRYKNTFGDERRDYFRGRFSRMSTHHGQRNFHSYCYRASDITGSKEIKKQIRPFWAEYRSRYQKPS
jgi:RNA-directed DNA polymerase